MSCPNEVQVVPTVFTEGDLEQPISVSWNEALTTETSELVLEQPDGTVKTIVGALVQAATGTFQYVWSAGDLVAGEGQLVKARLYRSGGTRRQSTVFFRINVQEDLV